MHLYRTLPTEKKTLLSMVNKQLGLGRDIAFDLFSYMIGHKPDFPASLSQTQREDLNDLSKITNAGIEV